MKKHTRTAAFALALCICAVSAAGCGDKKTADNSSYDKAEKTTTAAVTEAAATEAAQTTEEITTEAVTEAATEAAPTELSEKYADLDNRCFKYDGHLYTLGVSTLQDFLDNGAEFTKTENYDKMWTDKFRGQVDYGSFECKSAVNSAEFSFAKLSDDPVPMKDCILVGIDYFNKFEYERNGTDLKIQFAFPNTLTMEELTANSGEPTSKKGDKEVSYTEVSSVYPKYDSGYTFHFGSDGLINSVEIEWIP